MTGIQREFSLSSSSIVHHLRVLEDKERIISHKDTKYKRFYVNKNGYRALTNGDDYKPIVSALKNRTSRRVIDYLLCNPGATQQELAQSLGLHPSTVHWHAKRLGAVDIVRRRRQGKGVVYSIEGGEKITRLLDIMDGA